MGAAADAPSIQDVTGINSKAPPPPDMVDIINAIIPAKKRLIKCQVGIVNNISINAIDPVKIVILKPHSGIYHQQVIQIIVVC